MLTKFASDSFLQRSYRRLTSTLHPDTAIFLGDLFDGGREWATAKGNAEDPAWSANLRPLAEKQHLDEWRHRYGHDFWLTEYARFGDIYYDAWNRGGTAAAAWQRGRRILATIPGNHDLGIGAQIKIPVRNRFETFFGQGNRVDVIGNHTFVSVDAVSLSATSSDRPEHERRPVVQPVEDFLRDVQAMKRRATERELAFLSGNEQVVQQQPHRVEDLSDYDQTRSAGKDRESSIPELPTILLTHVPLFRNVGTPCGPLRERSPPTKPAPGQTNPISPDIPNAISISRGYQYQNVLENGDSVRLVSSIGNVVSVFSGDDHDYCDVTHPDDKNGAREITVKSISSVMGVKYPGVLMLSMWNPLNADGSSQSAPQATIQTHLCLLPYQLGILARYVIFSAITLAALIAQLGRVPRFLSRHESRLLLPLSIRDASLDIDSHDRSLHCSHPARSSVSPSGYRLPPHLSSISHSQDRYCTTSSGRRRLDTDRDTDRDRDRARARSADEKFRTTDLSTRHRATAVLGCRASLRQVLVNYWYVARIVVPLFILLNVTG